jgi:hypothetical protein
MDSVFQRFFSNLMKYGLEWFGLYYGEYDGVCANVEDPEEQGRIKVTCPPVAGNKEIGAWAWPRFMWSGKNSGTFMVPDVGDPVTVTFRNGRPSFPLYTGGSWPKIAGGDSYAPTGVYVDGVPYVRLTRTKAGHELSFSDNPDNLNCKLIWHNPDDDKYTFITLNKDGSIQASNHKGGLFEMRAQDDDKDLNMLVDSRGNSIIQDKNGTKIVDASGNVFELKEDTIQFVGNKDYIITSQAVNMKTGSVVLGDGASESAVRGTTWFQWFTTTFLPHYMAHTHGTGVGPSGPPMPPPLQQPVQTDILTDKVKVP